MGDASATKKETRGTREGMKEGKRRWHSLDGQTETTDKGQETENEGGEGETRRWEGVRGWQGSRTMNGRRKGNMEKGERAHGRLPGCLAR